MRSNKIDHKRLTAWFKLKFTFPKSFVFSLLFIIPLPTICEARAISPYDIEQPESGLGDQVLAQADSIGMRVDKCLQTKITSYEHIPFYVYFSFRVMDVRRKLGSTQGYRSIPLYILYRRSCTFAFASVECTNRIAGWNSFLNRVKYLLASVLCNEYIIGRYTRVCASMREYTRVYAYIQSSAPFMKANVIVFLSTICTS